MSVFSPIFNAIKIPWRTGRKDDLRAKGIIQIKM